MKAVVQRVRSASVDVGSDRVGQIGPGLCVLIGVTHTDTAAEARALAEKVWNLRVLDDEAGSMNRSLAQRSDAGGPPEVLVVSQFTLYADTSRGRRPSWIDAAPPEVAEPLVAEFAVALEVLGAVVATGRFGADMLVTLANDGP